MGCTTDAGTTGVTGYALLRQFGHLDLIEAVAITLA